MRKKSRRRIEEQSMKLWKENNAESKVYSIAGQLVHQKKKCS